MTSSRVIKSNGLARPKPFTFYPPKNNRFVTAVIQRLVRRDIRRKAKVTEIAIDPASLDRLRALQGQRCLITPSHSGGFEPHMLMYLSKLLDEEFNYLAASELFADSLLHRWVLQRVGVYSIIRGTVDRPSFAMTRQLLADGKRRLIIFPEGETIWQNSTLIPFQPGVIQLAFKAYADATKSDPTASLYCIPMAIRYVYLKDMHNEIDASLHRLTHHLSIANSAASGSRYDQLRAVAEAVLSANERVYGVTHDEESSFNDRIQYLRDRILTKLEQQLALSPATGKHLLERIRTVFNAVDRIVEQPPPESDYERRLVHEHQQTVRDLYCDLWRELRFVAIYDGYVTEAMNVERFMDVLCLLEFEVFGHRRVWGPRKACIEVGEPIDLKDHFADYSNDRHGTGVRVTMMLETSVQKMLDSLEGQCQPLRVSDG